MPHEDPDDNDYGYCMDDSSEEYEEDNATEKGKDLPIKSEMWHICKNIERLTNVNADEMKQLNDVNFEERRKFYAISITNFIFFAIQMVTVLITQVFSDSTEEGTSIFILKGVGDLPRVPIFVSAPITDFGWAGMFMF